MCACVRVCACVCVCMYVCVCVCVCVHVLVPLHLTSDPVQASDGPHEYNEVDDIIAVAKQPENNGTVVS